MTITAVLVALALAALATAASAASYTALGDSHSSGVGTRSFYNDGSECKRSPLAYPTKVAADRKLTLTFAACSGAKTSDRAEQAARQPQQLDRGSRGQALAQSGGAATAS